MSAVGPRTLVAVVAIASLLVVGGFAVPPAMLGTADGPEPAPAPTQPTPASVKVVTVAPNSSEALWPYTSRRRSFDTATLPINVVVQQDASFVRYLLAHSTGATWRAQEKVEGNASAANGSVVESGVVLNGTSIEWASARGSTRYTYLHHPDTGRGTWVDETYQLHDGAYLGTRYHLRLYAGGTGDDRWTAIQVHREHWDWFRLRHTVDSVDRAQDYLEGEFYDTWFLESVERERYANGGALDADGWVSVIRLTDRSLTPPRAENLAVLLWLAGLTGLQRSHGEAVLEAIRDAIEDGSVELWYLPLVGALLLLPLAVRVGGVTLETSFPSVSPKVIAGVLYLVLVVGIPASAYRFSRALPPARAATAAPAALGAGILLDYAYLEISALPIGIVVHRALLLVAVGVLAGGAALETPSTRRVDLAVAIGAGLWVVGLVIPLFELF